MQQRQYMNNTIRFTFILLLCGMLCSAALLQPKAPAATGNDTNARVKALFIYNFSKYIEWPGSMNSATFRIAVLGNYPTLVNELTSMASFKKGGNLPFEIVSYNDIDEINNCHILFVEPLISVKIDQVVEKLNGNNTLLVTERDGLANTVSAINFYYADSKQRMEINQANITKYNLKVSSKLLAIAKVVN